MMFPNPNNAILTLQAKVFEALDAAAARLDGTEEFGPGRKMRPADEIAREMLEYMTFQTIGKLEDNEDFTRKAIEVEAYVREWLRIHDRG